MSLWMESLSINLFTAEISELPGQRLPKSCPKCGTSLRENSLTSMFWEDQREYGEDITHWENTCDKCGVKIIVYND